MWWLYLLLLFAGGTILFWQTGQDAEDSLRAAAGGAPVRMDGSVRIWVFGAVLCFIGSIFAAWSLWDSTKISLKEWFDRRGWFWPWP